MSAALEGLLIDFGADAMVAWREGVCPRRTAAQVVEALTPAALLQLAAELLAGVPLGLAGADFSLGADDDRAVDLLLAMGGERRLTCLADPGQAPRTIEAVYLQLSGLRVSAQRRARPSTPEDLAEWMAAPAAEGAP